MVRSALFTCICYTIMLKLVAIVRKVDIFKSYDCDMHITV